MPESADLIAASTTPRQFALRGRLYGTGCPWNNDLPGWSLFGRGVKDMDLPRPLANGSKATNDKTSSRVFTAALSCVGAGFTEAEAEAAMLDLEEVFDASSTDIELHMRFASGHAYLVGRPRGVTFDTVELPNGFVYALVTFKAHDPTIYWVGS